MIQSKIDDTKEIAMENWIKEILQTETRILPFDRFNHLPFYLQTKYDFSYLELDGKKNLLLVSKNDHFSIQAILKEIILCKNIIDIPVIYSCTKLSSYQRNLLLRNHIPFIVKGNAVSLPFLGMYLSEKANSIYKKAISSFSPITQLVYLYLFYSSYFEVPFKQLSHEMKISKMSVSRAIEELVTLKIVEVESIGKSKKIIVTHSRKAFLKSALPFLQNPVLKVVYAPSLPLNEHFPAAGTKALSDWTMLEENRSIVALYLSRYQSLRKTFEFYADDTGVNVEIEIWKYNPILLSRDGKVDKISLYLSLKDNQDERVRNELNTLWETENGKWD